MALANFSRPAAVGQQPGAPVFHDRVQLDLDDSYPTGGYDLSSGSANRLLLDAVIGSGKTILYVLQQGPIPLAGAGLMAVWDSTNSKLMMLNNATGAEISNGSDLSGVTDLDIIFVSN